MLVNASRRDGNSHPEHCRGCGPTCSCVAHERLPVRTRISPWSRFQHAGDDPSLRTRVSPFRPVRTRSFALRRRNEVGSHRPLAARLTLAPGSKSTGKGNLFVIFGEPDIRILAVPDAMDLVRV